MLLIKFLEATAEYTRLKAHLEGERQLISLEKEMTLDVARVFRLQGALFLKYLPDTFDLQDANRAWDQVTLETYLIFKDVLSKYDRRIARVGVENVKRCIAPDVRIQEAAKPRTIDKIGISFDGFDEEAYDYLQNHAGERISRIDETTRKEIQQIIVTDFKGKLQPDGTTKYKSVDQIARDIKNRFADFSAPQPQKHIRNRAELVATTELAEGYESSKEISRNKLEEKGWSTVKSWSNTGDGRVSEGCKANSAAGWIPNNQPFPSGHMHPPRFPGCRCSTQTRLGDPTRKTDLPADRWIVTRDGDTVKIRKNPKYKDGYPLPNQVNPFKTADIPPYHREDLTPETKQVIGDWVKNSNPINTALRYGENDEFFKNNPGLFEESINKANLLSDVIERSRLEQEYNVSRGLGPYDVNKVKDALSIRKKSGISTLIEDNGFTAVSYQNKTALKYAEPDNNGEKYLIVSKLHRGDKALFIGNENPSYDRKEGEILLQKKTGYYITGERTIITDDNEIVHLIEVVYRGIR